MLTASRFLDALKLPPSLLLQVATTKARSAWHDVWTRRLDVRRCTYMEGASVGPLQQILGPVPSSALEERAAHIRALSGHAIAHRFDLLGSGWVEVKHGMQCRGIEGYRYDSGTTVDADSEGGWLTGRVTPANLAESQGIWRLVSRGYTPIDWHLDFKSGCRWPEQTWYRDVRYGEQPGADIKVPWELSRMQGLPLLALAHALESASGDTPRSSIYLVEFRNQVLDFLAANPPRFGVNWSSSMDVGIRVVNLLMAWDLFRAQGAGFDAPFEALFARSIMEHGRHIAANLEWDPRFRGNHYLANLAGLLFCSTYLARIPETDAWLAFAVQGLQAEAQGQFLDDGANFEASTCYHRLSTEMLLYCTALIVGLAEPEKAALLGYDYRRWRGASRLRPGPVPLRALPGNGGQSPFSAVHFERLERAVEFTVHLTKPSNRVAQIGDSDSGRFLKLIPPLLKTTVAGARAHYANLEGYAELPDDAPYWEEDHLDHHQLLAAANGLFPSLDCLPETAEHSLESWMVSRLARGQSVASYRRRGTSPAAAGRGAGVAETLNRLEAELRSLPRVDRRTIEVVAAGTSLGDGLILYAYPNFGSYLFRSSRLFLSVRCGSIGQNGLGGHAHNDQLSIELAIDGEDWIADPGSYLYTALPARRNEYRSMLAHCGPWLHGGEPGRLDLGLFRLGGESSARCLHFSEAGFAGVLEGPGRTVYCVLRVGAQGITVEYFCVGDRLGLPAPGVPFSPGYGIVRRRETKASNPRVVWMAE
jgi:heparinase II/III-like protein